MKAIDVIRMALQRTDEFMAGLVEDLHNDPLACSTPGAKAGNGNHALWILGHLAVIEGDIPRILLGEKNPVEHWRPLFAAGTAPSSDPSVYPSFDEVLRTCRSLRAGTLRLLESVGDAGFERIPKAIPPGFENAMATFGQTFLVLALHQMVHCGQLTDVRRVAGHRPRM